MRIAIDASQIVYDTGVSVYTKNLIRNLIKIDKRDEYILFGGSLRKFGLLRKKLLELGENCSTRVFPIPPTLAHILWNKLHIFPIENFLGMVDVFHSSDWTQPPASCFKVTTIHDLAPLKFPKLSHPKIVSVHSKRLEWVFREVQRIIVPSNQIFSELKELGLDAARIRVIPEACDPIFKPLKKDEVSRIKRKYRIIGDYFLVVGVSLRKNIERIMEATERIRGETGMKLVLVGRVQQGVSLAKIYRRGVIFLGHVHKEDLPALYCGAKVFVYPSLYEGFGLPILEAFACKVPVVTSNLGSMKEIANNAAVLVDPYDVGSIVDGVLTAIKNRKSLIKRGRRRLKFFSWKKTSQKTLEVYRESQRP